MRKFYSLLFILIFSATIGQAQTFTRMQSWGLDFEALAWIDENRGFIVGEELIAFTEDGGLTWKEVLQEFDFRFNDVIFLNENLGFAVGEAGRIFRTIDGGKSWIAVPSGTAKDLLSIEKSGEETLFVVGEDGIVLRSENAGQNWASVDIGITSSLNEVTFQQNGLGFICGDQGKISKTLNGGVSWETLSTGITEGLKTIEIAPTGRVFAAGEGGKILYSLDTGKNWTQVISPVLVDFHQLAISPLDQRIVVISGSDNTIIRSTNSGLTFSRINTPAQGLGRRISGLSFKPGLGVVYAVGKDGYSIFSNNSGGSWANRLLGNRVHFYSLEFLTNTYALTGGTGGRFFVTSNSFFTVIERALPEQITIRSLDFWNTNYGFVGGDGGKIFRTSNAGQAWVDLSLPSSQGVRGFHLFLPEFPYLSGETGLIARSSGTSGSSWELFQQGTTNTNQTIHDILGFDLTNAMAVGGQGYISISNTGNTWQKVESGTVQDLLFSTQINDSSAMVVGKKGTILRTRDLGKTWRKIEVETEENLLGVDFFGAGNGFIVGENGLFLLSIDGGESWRKVDAGTGRSLHAVFAVNPNRAFAVGDDGTVIGYDCVPPAGNLGEIAGISTSCLQTTTYSISESPQAGSEILWRVDGGEILSGQGTDSIEVKWTIPGRNAVLVSRANFCGAGQTSFLEVLVSDTPSNTTPLVGLGSVCLDELTTYSLPNRTGVTYIWSVSGGEVVTGQGTNQIQVRWTSQGLQSIQLIQENFCGKSTELITPVQVAIRPEIPDEIQGEVLVGLGEQSYEVPVLPGLDYRWTLSGGGRILSGQGSGKIQIIWESEGNFEVSVEAQNACNFGPKQVLPVKVDIISSVTGKEPRGVIKIYPNPSFTGNLTLESPELDQWTSLELYTGSGQKIQERPIFKGERILFLENLPRGLLLLRFVGPQGFMQEKILVL
ncbi:YCF48-related protein [Algoriphagus confluentis]|uniref:Photosynthesis system II assembly factor Ycf48/Hcf136-like domain-containing protein n=1 Tax=Algoriphagus confluentis TaxID=1697556 RepID=A0ABQ6PLT6_9BACT|nr:hypothetical protein Aconfl_15840 [Algoriphagus confluentis]